MSPEPRALLHASCVALGARGALITGPSGSGKSALALALLAMGARLVADDRTWVALRAGGLCASAPPALRGRIEARCVGLLAAESLAEAPLVVYVDLARTESARLPQRRSIRLLGRALPLLHKPESGGFAPALLQYLAYEQDA